MKKDIPQEYWLCIIGTATSDQLKQGADYPMRTAVRNAFKQTVGKENDVIWSGWGMEKEKVDIINLLCVLRQEDSTYKKIKKLIEKRTEQNSKKSLNGKNRI